MPKPRIAGAFIVLEGADGSGKSTQARRLAALLASKGRKVLHLRDPGSTPLAEAVRSILLDTAHGPVDPAAEACLYFAARAQLAAEVIAPALAEGTVVVCERWTLSTEVYQGAAGGFGAARIRSLERLVVPTPRPDRVFVLDVPEGGGIGRIERPLDRMESKGAGFHGEVAKAYRRLCRGRRGHRLVPAGSEDMVSARIAKLALAATGDA
ncbi:MAG: Thymidylate kinase [Planctomycetes bacterium]|nr:Thymidylate kinase [Planctomycetota bacterium]